MIDLGRPTTGGVVLALIGAVILYLLMSPA